MLTAAIRDLHLCHPHQFLTDVRTRCPELWEHNPYITPLSEKDAEVELIECEYPLINRCNETPYHCLHGFIEFFNDKLKLQIKPTVFRGDIHLSPLEKSWYSQVYEVTRQNIPFWIVAAGGKYDITIKWWDTQRYQQVIDYFQGKIQFVQIGAEDHYHPKLKGVIDLRGRTNLRELIRLVYHAQGVLCSVTAVMHLAAAIEMKQPRIGNRSCVVIAGGREPSHWEAYPDHQFIHNNGALRCCTKGGCWKDRIVPLGDGDDRDKPNRLCTDVIEGLPRCMDLIHADEVIRRIELYFNGGLLKYLSPQQELAAKRGRSATAKNPLDDQPLNLHNAGLAFDRFIKTIPIYPGYFKGRGIVICAGGVKLFTNAWVCINMLRYLKCQLPIQLWYLGPEELDDRMKELVAPLQVECVDGLTIRKRFPVGKLGGWELKPYAILHCPYEQVLLLDADNMPVTNPEYLFETSQFQTTGAVFWPDYGQFAKGDPIWQSCGLSRPKGPEFESGQLLVDKRRCWQALSLSMWMNEHSDFYYRYIHGDKETFHIAFRKLEKTFALINHPIEPLPGTMCQHDFEGQRVFQHRNSDKWNLFLSNNVVTGFKYEQECRQFIKQLQSAWDGRSSFYYYQQISQLNRKPSRSFRSKLPIIQACMMTCPERKQLCDQTIKNFAATDWNEGLAFVQMDNGENNNHHKRQMRTAWLALKHCLDLKSDYFLFFEDDLIFNKNLRYNLEQWMPLREQSITLAGLYNPGLHESACNIKENFMVINPNAIFGSQAFLISRATVQYLTHNWNRVQGLQDIKISRLAGRLKQPILYHAPSLVDHVGEKSVWGGWFHRAIDFDPLWRACPV